MANTIHVTRRQALSFFIITAVILFARTTMPTNEVTQTIHAAQPVQLLAPADVGLRARAYEFSAPVAEREHWKAGQFFDDPETLAICDALSAHDDALLRKFVKTPGNNLHARGKNGFTLLHWAYAEHNLPGFEMLLDAGVSPDLKLTGYIHVNGSIPFFNNDSVLFTVLRRGRYDFFMAALSYTKNGNQRDGHGDLLIHEFFAPYEPSNFKRFGLTSEDMLSTLIETKIDLNVPNRYGILPLHRAAQNRRVSLCQILLKAGANPHLANEHGQTFRNYFNTYLKDFENGTGKGKSQKTFTELIRWLDAYDKAHPETLPAPKEADADSQRTRDGH